MTIKSLKEHNTQWVIDTLIEQKKNKTMEGELLQKQLIRELYKRVDAPDRDTFPAECKIAGETWKTWSGYTTGIDMYSELAMLKINAQETAWSIARPSQRKIDIVNRYTKAGWTSVVLAYNVLCKKFVKHPKYDRLWVEFYSSHECNKYRFVLEKEEE